MTGDPYPESGRPSGCDTTQRPTFDWPTLRGLGRSLAIYYGVPFRGLRLTRFYRRLLGPGTVYFDIGAHVGHRVRAALKTGARVVAVEPQPLFFNLLDRLYGRSDRVTLVSAAMGAEPGRITLRISRTHPTVSTVDPDWVTTVQSDPGFAEVQWDRRVDVAVTTLDGLIAQYGVPDFCKIDVEGYEAEVLRGTAQALPHISFEALPAAPDAAQRCLTLLESRGDYRFNLVRGEANAFAFDTWQTAATMQDRLTAETGPGDVHARLAHLGPVGT